MLKATCFYLVFFFFLKILLKFSFKKIPFLPSLVCRVLSGRSGEAQGAGWGRGGSVGLPPAMGSGIEAVFSERSGNGL